MGPLLEETALRACLPLGRYVVGPRTWIHHPLAYGTQMSGSTLYFSRAFCAPKILAHGRFIYNNPARSQLASEPTYRVFMGIKVLPLSLKLSNLIIGASPCRDPWGEGAATVDPDLHRRSPPLRSPSRFVEAWEIWSSMLPGTWSTGETGIARRTSNSTQSRTVSWIASLDLPNLW